MKKNTIILKINLSKDDFDTTVKVEKKHFTKKEKILLKIALFTLQNQIDNFITKI